MSKYEKLKDTMADMSFREMMEQAKEEHYFQDATFASLVEQLTRLIYNDVYTPGDILAALPIARDKAMHRKAEERMSMRGQFILPKDSFDSIKDEEKST